VKKIGKSFVGILTLLGICFVVLITYVSLLGENNKIDSVVDNFFSNLQAQRYFLYENNQNIVEGFDIFDMDGVYSDNCLFLELALFEKYNISDPSDYEIEIKKSHFWIPFINNQNIQIDVSLLNSEDSKFFSLSNDLEFVDNLFTVARKDGRWLIASINILASPLFESVNGLRESLKIDSYVTITGTKLSVSPIEIDTQNITVIERRKLNYIFQNLYQITESKINTNIEP
jgi:hypothetical protein